MKKIIFTICLIILVKLVFGQDIIVKKSGAEINCKVSEVTSTDIKYKKTDNPDVTYSISKSEVFMIKYANGNKDVFTDETKSTETKSDETKTTETKNNNVTETESSAVVFAKITKKGNKVFVDCDNDELVLNATECLKDWGYWEVTTIRKEADLILKFKLKYNLNGWVGTAEIINPKTDEVLKETQKEYENAMAMNGKKSIMKRIIFKRIKPLIE